jgi:hypothetical protein
LIYGSPQKRAQRAAAEQEVAEAAAVPVAEAGEGKEGSAEKSDVDRFEEAAQMPEELGLADEECILYSAQDMQDKKGL